MDNSETPNPAASSSLRRSFLKELKFNGWLAVATVTYLVTILLVRDHPEWSPKLKVALTLLPVIPGLLYFRSGIRLLKSKDELQRRIQFEAWLFAALGTVVVSTIINVMNAHGMIWDDYPHGLEMGATYMLMFILWCFGVSLANRRYNSK
jgi:hypothetical protein